MKKSLILLIALLNFHFSYSQQYYTHCLSANKYLHNQGEGEPKTYNKKITLCWNDIAFGFWVDGGNKILIIDKYTHDVSIIKPPYMQEEFSAKEFQSDPYPSYIITIIHSSPMEVTINYTEFGGYSYFFKCKGEPAIKEQIINNESVYHEVVFDPKYHYASTNDSLNPKLKCEAICPINIKKYLKTHIPYLNKSFGSISLVFNILPNGKAKFNGAGYDINLSKKTVDKLSVDLSKAISKMPVWKIPEGMSREIHGYLDIEF